MKRILFLLVFLFAVANITVAKDFPKDSLYYGTPGDSVSNLKFNSLFKYTYFTYQDTGSTVTLGGLSDSAIVEAQNALTGEWYLVGIIDITTDAVSDSLIGTSGSIRKYLINEVKPYNVRIRLLNYRAAFPARKGYVVWSGEND